MPSRVYAAIKFFLYTLLGSVLLLIAMAWMYVTAGTTDIPTLQQYDFRREHRNGCGLLSSHPSR